MSPVWNQPSFDDLVGGVLAVPVALHHVVAADRDLAHLALLDRLAVVVDDPHLDALDRRADRARLALLVGVVERGDRRGLGEPVALEDDRVEGLLELLITSTGIAEPPEMHSRRLDTSCSPSHAEQGVVHRRHALEDGDAVALDDLERLLGLEARDQRERRRRPRPRRSCAQVCPKAWNSGSAPRITSSVGGLDQRPGRDLRVAAQVVVRELGALGRAGRPGGVEDHRGVVAVALDVLVGARSRRRAASRTRPA